MESHDIPNVERAQLALAAARFKALRDYNYFMKVALGIDCHYNNEPAVSAYLGKIGSEVYDWLKTRDKRTRDGSLKQQIPRKMMVVEPRKTFKSAGVSEVLPVYAACHDPNIVCGLMCADYEKLAVPIAKNIRTHFEGETAGSRLKALFGEFKSPENWSGSSFKIAVRDSTVRDPTVSAYGVRQGAVGHHFDLFIIDDPVTNEAMANNSDWLDRVWRSWVDLKATLNPNSMVVLIMTRYHDADLAGRIIKREIEPAVLRSNGGTAPEDWHPEDPAALVKYGPLAGWTIVYDRAVDDPNSDNPTYNFPGIWSAERIRDVRAGKSMDGDEESEEYSELFFWCQLQNAPQKREDNPIQPQHIAIARGTPDRWTIDHVPRVGFVDIHCDFAFKSAEAYLKQAGDWGVAHVTVPNDGKVWRAHGYRGKVPQDEFGQQLIRLAHWAKNALNARVRFLTFDKLTGQGSGDQSTTRWLRNLFLMQPDLNIPTFMPISRNKRKEQYILDTVWAWQEGWVRLVESAPGVSQLIYQMERIGYSDHDDDADSFANAFHPDIYRSTARVEGPDEEGWNWEPAIAVTDDYGEYDDTPSFWAGG